MKLMQVQVAFGIALMMLAAVATTPGAVAGESKQYKVPFMLGKGKQRFQKLCAQCHGAWAEGSDQGPPLIHRYYEPGHHDDAAFFRAVSSGVRQHHWGFGDMKPVPDASEKDVRQIVGFVRWLQRQNGIGH